jgi:hypothetical protein
MGLVEDPMAAVEVAATEGAKVTTAVVMVPVQLAAVAGTTTTIATGVASRATGPRSAAANSPKWRSKGTQPKRRSLHFFSLRSIPAAILSSAVAAVMSLGEAMVPTAAGLPQGRPLSIGMAMGLV